MSSTVLSTAESVGAGYDFTGKTAIVTGANSGIGKETARVLALRNCHVILGCRTLEKGNEAKAEIVQSIGSQKADLIEVALIDLSSLQSVRDSAAQFGGRRVHLLVNNAGVQSIVAGTKTQDGFELHFGVNHLATALLTFLLFPNLRLAGKEDDPARIIILASEGHRVISADEAASWLQGNEINPDFALQLDANKEYCASKCFNILFANGLQRRLESSQIRNVICQSVHPGLIMTNILTREMGEEEALKRFQKISEIVKAPLLSISEGAATTLYVAGSPDCKVNGGRYFKDCQPSNPSNLMVDHAWQDRLWSLTERLVNENFAVTL